MSKKSDNYPASIPGIFFRGVKRAISRSLFTLWCILSVLLIIGVLLGYVNVDHFSVSTYLSVCIAGLSFTFALFNISKSTFELEELQSLMTFEGNLNTSGRNIKKGDLFFEYLSPFILTTSLLAFLAVVSLLSPYLVIEVSYNCLTFFKIIYLSFMILAIFSLLNITYMAIEDLSNSVLRKSKDEEI